VPGPSSSGSYACPAEAWVPRRQCRRPHGCSEKEPLSNAGGKARATEAEESRRCPPDRPQVADQGRKGIRWTRRNAPDSGGDQGSAETCLIRLVLIPEVDADQPPLLFQTDHPIDLGVGTQVAISWSPKPHSKRNMVALRQLPCCQKMMPEFGRAIGREGRNAYARTSLSSEGVDHESRYGTRTGILGR
jgi:hypothetical protein